MSSGLPTRPKRGARSKRTRRSFSASWPVISAWSGAANSGAAQVITPSGKALAVKLEKSGPGVFTGSVEVKEIGLYQVGNGNLSTLAHVGPVNAPEFTDVVSTEEKLKPAADLTGGSVRRLAASADSAVALPAIVPVRSSGEASGRDWIGLRTTDDSTLKAVSRVPLFGGFLGLGLLLLAIGAMWHREGR